MRDVHTSIKTAQCALLFAAATLMAGCLTDEEVSDSEVAIDETRVSGSVGDGPVVGAAITIRDQAGVELASFESNVLAGFNVSVKVKGAQYPLMFNASDGTDLVTNLTPDFEMTGAILRPSTRVVSNINPFSTFAISLASEMPGGVTAKNIEAADMIVSDQLNCGLMTLVSSGARQTHIDENNITEIVKASETLSEIVRRTRDLLSNAGYFATGDSVIAALGADLTDEVIDGRGGSAVDARTAAVATIVGAQVLIESMANELFVNGSSATAAMDAAINNVSVRNPTTELDDLPVTAIMKQKATIGLEAAMAIDSSSGIVTLHSAVSGIQAGMDAPLVRTLLPSNYRSILQNTLVSVASADSSVIDAVNAVARGESSTPPANRAPAISGAPGSMVEVGSTYVFIPTASDPDGDTLSFSATNLPAWASINSSTGRVSGAPGQGDAGTTSDIVVTASDGELSASLAPFSITVFEGNMAPTISGTPASQVVAGQGYVYAPTANDPNGDALTFSISGQPSWTTFNPTNGRLTGAPDIGDVGTYANVVITVSDGQLSDSTSPFSITVMPSNTAPTISGTPPSAATVGQQYSFTPAATDADGDALTFSVSNLPSWANFNTTTGRINGTPGAGDVGTYTNVSITVSDGVASDTLAPFSITVDAVSLGSVSLSWTPPTENEDGSVLTDLAGYRLYWGTTPGVYTDSVTINNPSISTYLVENMTPGSYEFVATSFNSSGVESTYSTPTTKVVP